jgi:hypothetical protein
MAEATLTWKPEEPETPVDAELAGNIERSRTRESLKCRLSDDEVRELGIQSARLGALIHQEEADLKAVKSQFNARIDKLTAERAEADIKINAGWEFRTVECEVIKEFTTNTARTIRLDTNELVRERALTIEERQQSLIPQENVGDPGDALGESSAA